MVREDTVRTILAFVVLFVAIFVFGTFFLTAHGYDLITSSTAVIAALGNIGPGLSRVGPVASFAFFSSSCKIFLSGCMILGRLEIFTIIVLLVPQFWKK